MAERRLRGTPAAPGVAVGRVVRYTPIRMSVSREPLPVEQVEGEIDRLHRAIARVRERTAAARDATAAWVGEKEAAVFDAHLLMLDDPALIGEAERRIREQYQRAGIAIQEVAADVRRQLERLQDPYLRARAADVEDIATQVLRALADGYAAGAPEFPENTIVVAEELLPSDTALFNPNRVVALVTERGSRTAHVAILARAMEMPAVVGVAGAAGLTVEGEGAIVDGDWGEVVLSPEPSTLTEFQDRLNAARQERERQQALHEIPAITLDQARVAILANIGTPAEARIALENGAEGIGLFRTEFLFLDRATLPSEEEQYDAYRQVAKLMGNRPVVIRTLDAGGDKPVPGITLPPETNPFLGVRGVRLTLRYPDLLRTQLRAILRAAVDGNVWIMFPMVATGQDVRDARQILDEVVDDLVSRGVPHRSADVPVGIMVEVPSAALAADRLIREVDFFSIGTNDLVQYTLAVDRTNDQLARRYSPLDIGVLRLIGQVISAAEAAGKPVAVCGELAGDPAALPSLIGLGARELSMTATAMAQAKTIIRSIRAAAVAEEVRRRIASLDNEEEEA